MFDFSRLFKMQKNEDILRSIGQAVFNPHPLILEINIFDN
jgi:hypothetical protein